MHRLIPIFPFHTLQPPLLQVPVFFIFVEELWNTLINYILAYNKGGKNALKTKEIYFQSIFHSRRRLSFETCRLSFETSALIWDIALSETT